MKVEESLVKRAAVHAALGEPVRLAIAETLSLGDASPSALGARLELASNLLAHHLAVLEAAGLVRRSRSDADRRRSYVCLTELAYPWVALPPIGEVARVVFVCTRNSARSQLAAALWANRSRVPVASAGTEPADDVDPRALAAARRQRLKLRRARTAHVADVLQPDDLVVSVCDRAYERLTRSRPVGLHWSVPDPARGGGAATFDRALSTLRGRVSRLAEAIPG